MISETFEMNSNLPLQEIPASAHNDKENIDCFIKSNILSKSISSSPIKRNRQDWDKSGMAEDYKKIIKMLSDDIEASRLAYTELEEKNKNIVLDQNAIRLDIEQTFKAREEALNNEIELLKQEISSLVSQKEDLHTEMVTLRDNFCTLYNDNRALTKHSILP
eukprot:TRINITY_DN1114_c0_g1_i3.p1 TRINITY_DN1114_c0_g1~~TRINITY_DN1114_c0_g1_i3.p1  ORF type:complete len:162 (-),score=28.88 TRINITY_DN1114_c0_g1_i3:111-596(-)